MYSIQKSAACGLFPPCRRFAAVNVALTDDPPAKRGMEMKNQYIGDIGDYGKYGLLRFLKANEIDIGVNWYLTPDDGRTDGNHTEYLSDTRMSVYDPEVYKAMREIAFRKDKTIRMLEQNPVLQGFRFYDAMMDFSGLHWRDRAGARLKWHAAAMYALRDSALVFADPDTCLSTAHRPSQKDAQKYILPLEIVDYYRRGQQVMYYHHRSRKNEDGWMEEKRRIKAFLPDAMLLALSFHRWSARTFIFVVHRDQFERYSRLTNAFVQSAWGTHRIDGKAPFTVEQV